ncbi:MAG TPA: alpha/beta hydrolase-fold protein, partial [Planctomycetota bacterium]|nr:alpha/beta hydrolase-fold protein [Planctomycetota bacterium]
MPRTACLVATVLLAVLALPAQDAKSPLDLTPSEDVPASWGKSFRGTLASQALGEARSFRLWLPASHAATARRYPTVFVTDSDHHFVDVVTAVRQLAQAGHVPECLVVGVSTRARTQDLTPPGMDAYIAEGEARGDRLLRFLAEELAPALAAQRSTRPFVLLGHSHGAILAHHAAAAWRREFPFVIALDGPMHLSDHWLCQRLETSVAKGGHLRLVSLEARFGW